MNVTNFSNTLAEMNPTVKWPSIYADQIYSYHTSQRPWGVPLSVGTSLHQHFYNYSKDKRVPDSYFEVCASIVDVLYDLGMDQAECEVPVSALGLKGRLDIHGIDSKGRHWVIEIKTTQGLYLESPSGREIFQLALYAKMLDLETLPRLLCLRVNLRTQKIGVYHSHDCSQWADLIQSEAA